MNNNLANQTAAILSETIASQALRYAAAREQNDRLMKTINSLKKENEELRKEVAKYESSGNHASNKQKHDTGK